MSLARPVLYFGAAPPRVSNVATRRTGLVTPVALGRTKSAVLGSGRVDGIPVYGQAKVVTTNYKEHRVGSTPVFSAPDPTSVATIDVVYLLAKDYFRRGYKLLRIEADQEVVFDAENGAIPKIEFRFYDGLQTVVDPIVRQIVGENAGAHTGDVLLALPDYPSLKAPTITAVISNAATDTGGSGEISWTGQAPANMSSAYQHAAYDPVDGLIYQILTSQQLPGTPVMYLSVLDVDTYSELYRVPLQNTEAYVSGGVLEAEGVWATPLGLGFILVRLAKDDPLAPTRVYNATTGAYVAEWLDSATQNIAWQGSIQFGDNWLVAGADFSGANPAHPVVGVIDITAGTFDVTSLDTSQSFATAYRGRQFSASAASFFYVHAGIIYEITFSGDTWATTVAYTPAGTVTAVHYDPETEYLVVLEEFPSGTFNVQLVTPDTGAIADAFTVSLPLFDISGTFGSQRDYARPGYALFSSSAQDLWAVDIAGHTATKLADVNAETGQDVSYGFYDHARLSYFMSRGDTVWTRYTIPGTTPGQITTQSHIVDLLTYLGPYTIDQIEFSGFEGLTDWGDVIDKNISIKALLRTYQDPLGFVWSDIGSKIVFRKTPTDGSFTPDASIADTDIVFKKGGSIKSDDESDITRVAKVSLEYVSKDDNYQPRTVTADAFGSLYEVTRSTKAQDFSTSLTLSDTDGERLVHELLWRLQARTHAFSAYAEFARMIPGDVVTVVSGAVSYAVELTKVNIKESLVVELEARDFQTSLSAEVAAVTNAGFSGISTVTVLSQYIHLDIPLLRYSDDAAGAGIVQYGVVASRGQANWGGGTLYADLAPEYDQAPHGGVIGVCDGALGNPLVPFATDDDSTVTIRKISGNAALLVDRTEADVLAGQNLAFIGTAGRWEGVGYKAVTDNGDGSYTLSGFAVRGYRGTEVFAHLHQVGDLFVLASPEWVHGVRHPTSDLNASKLYKAVGFGQSPAAVAAAAHVLRGAAETPYACVNLNASLGDSPPTGIDLSCDHRSRLAAGLNPANHGEATLAFEWDVMDGETVLRTLTSSMPSVHYIDTDIIADFGAYPDELTFRVYMMSAVVGRGYRAQRHVVFNYTPTMDSTVLTLDSTVITLDQE